MITFLMFGCKHQIPEVTAGTEDSIITVPIDTNSFSGIPCDEDSVYFQNEILPLLISTCAQPGCHDAQTAEDDVILTDYYSIIYTGDIDPGDPWDSDLVEVITESDPDDVMPPPGEGSLSADQIQMIIDWIAQGAVNNYCEGCDTTNITFAGAVYPIIDLKCQGCHSGNAPDGDLTLLSYSDVSGIAANGTLMSAILGEDGIPQMPYNGNPLQPCEIDLISMWIDEGYPNN